MSRCRGAPERERVEAVVQEAAGAPDADRERVEVLAREAAGILERDRERVEALAQAGARTRDLSLRRSSMFWLAMVCYNLKTVKGIIWPMRLGQSSGLPEPEDTSFKVCEVLDTVL